eukprot:m.99625 g.99625  ORF g.99625 m.99625 type:complete len:691 (+) comp15104_c0_seq1:118-2190(+)
MGNKGSRERPGIASYDGRHMHADSIGSHTPSSAASSPLAQAFSKPPVDGQVIQDGARRPVKAEPSKPAQDRPAISTPAAALPAGVSEDALVIASYDFNPRTANELAFKRGERLIITSKADDNWWQAKSQRSGKTGFIPSNYVTSLKSLADVGWYHGKIARTTAEYLLKSGIDGSFLIRESQSQPGEHSITMKHDSKVYHYRINKSSQGMYVAEGRYFQSLRDLVKYHSQTAEGLVAPLRHPVIKQQLKPLALSKEADDKWELSREEITMGKLLGSGQYGEVYQGHWVKFNRKVAVKTLKTDTMNEQDFLKEADVMKRMKHENLVRLWGICSQGRPLFIVTEFMPNGNLLDYLRTDAGRVEIDATAMMYCASQIAAGMCFLEEKRFIHRDLAARNCLVGHNLTVKLADFGLARFVRGDVYEAKEGTRFPIKWTAPESLTLSVFTIKSDVWAFGVTLWEIATYGGVPYPGVDYMHVLDKLESGYRMGRPEGCPLEIYQLMRQCWDVDPELRPSFHAIRERLENMYAGSTIEEAVTKTLTLDKGSNAANLGLDAEGLRPKSSSAGRTTAASSRNPAAIPQSERQEISTNTKQIFKQVAFLLQLPKDQDFVSPLRLLIMDAQQLAGAAKGLVGSDGSALRAIESLGTRLNRLAVIADEFEHGLTVDLIKRMYDQLKKVAGAAKAIDDSVKALAG